MAGVDGPGLELSENGWSQFYGREWAGNGRVTFVLESALMRDGLDGALVSAKGPTDVAS